VTVAIPLWLILLVVMVAPFVLAWVAALFEGEPSGYFAFPILTPLVFVVSAAACWTGLIVWAVTRYLS
jgi:hypothetical protein